MAIFDSGTRARTSRSTLVMRWQCGHHVANISSKYGAPASDDEENVPIPLRTANAGACEPTPSGGGNCGGLGATAEPGTVLLAWRTAYTVIAIMTIAPATLAHNAIARRRSASGCGA